MFIFLQSHEDVEKHPGPRKLKTSPSLPALNFSKLTQLKA